MSSERSSVLPNLTSIRIFAALYVLGYHVYGSPPYSPINHWYEHWLNAGYLGVSLFFVLSGFILAYTAREPLQKRRFYSLRFARIYPLYFMTALITLPNFLRHGFYSPAAVLLSDAFLVQAWGGPLFAAQLNGPSWSLSTEAFFYLTFPFLLPVVQRWMSRRNLTLALLGILAILPPALEHLWAWHYGQPVNGSLYNFLSFPPFRLCEFLIGMVFGLSFRQKRPASNPRSVAFATLLAIGVCGLHGVVPFDVMRNGLVALPFGWLIYELAAWPSRWLGSRAMQLAGEISYGVYLLQIPVTLASSVVAHRMGMPQLEVPLLFCSILPTAYLFFRFIEKPGRLLLLKLLNIRSHADPIPMTK